MVKRRISKKKVSIFIICVLLIISLIVGLVMFLKQSKGHDKPVKIKSADTIEAYDYTLSSNATKYYKTLFKELKKVLESPDLDENKYAELVTKLFIADFYNLDNKTNNNDVGGYQFVYTPFKEDFQKLATDSMYKSVENNLYNQRKQELPIVANVSVAKENNGPFTYNNQTDNNAYLMTFEIEYEKDLGYQKTGTVTLIHNDKKLEVAVLT